MTITLKLRVEQWGGSSVVIVRSRTTISIELEGHVQHVAKCKDPSDVHYKLPSYWIFNKDSLMMTAQTGEGTEVSWSRALKLVRIIVSWKTILRRQFMRQLSLDLYRKLFAGIYVMKVQCWRNFWGKLSYFWGLLCPKGTYPSWWKSPNLTIKNSGLLLLLFSKPLTKYLPPIFLSKVSQNKLR